MVGIHQEVDHGFQGNRGWVRPRGSRGDGSCRRLIQTWQEKSPAEVGPSVGNAQLMGHFYPSRTSGCQSCSARAITWIEGSRFQAAGNRWSYHSCRRPSRRDKLDGSDPPRGGRVCPKPCNKPCPPPRPVCRTSGKKGGSLPSYHFPLYRHGLAG